MMECFVEGLNFIEDFYVTTQDKDGVTVNCSFQPSSAKGKPNRDGSGGRNPRGVGSWLCGWGVALSLEILTIILVCPVAVLLLLLMIVVEEVCILGSGHRVDQPMTTTTNNTTTTYNILLTTAAAADRSAAGQRLE